MSRVRKYAIWSPTYHRNHLQSKAPGGLHEDRARWWRWVVKARSIEQAYHLVGRGICWRGEPGTVGVCEIHPPDRPRLGDLGRPIRERGSG